MKKQTALGQRAAGDAVQPETGWSLAARKYSMLGAAMQLGGVIAGVDEPAGAGRAEPSGAVPAGVAGGASARPLSTAHIRPQSTWPSVTWNRGGSLLQVSKGGVQQGKKGNTIRRTIKQFSADSRRRLMRSIGKVKRAAPLPLFVTLTWPASFPGPREAKHSLRSFIKRLRRQYPEAAGFWKLEPQERGAPHFHLLIWGAPLTEINDHVMGGLLYFVPVAWFDIAGQSDQNHLLFHQGLLPRSKPCVEQVRSWKGVWFYAAKYLGKTFEIAGWDWPGRFWGVINADAIPFGEQVTVTVSRRDAVQIQRYQRRFAKQRAHRWHRSVYTFVDADQWTRRLQVDAGQEDSEVLSVAEP